MTICAAKDRAWELDKSWLVMEESGELWAGEKRPEYHSLFGIWIWVLDIQPVKIGWIYPVKDWHSCVWRIG